MSDGAHLPLREVTRRVEALPDVRPLRILPLLLPMWAAEVVATVRESQPYDVLDRYLARAIDSGLLDIEELATFFGVEPAIVSRALRFLAGIGHLARDDRGRLTLTGLGRRSLADGRRYQLFQGRRLLLRFDGFTAAPVPYSCSAGSVWLRAPELTLSDGTAFQLVDGGTALPGDAVAALLARDDLADFTGPVEPVEAEQHGTRPLWLPVYLVECEDEPLVFGRALDGPDPYLARLMVSRPIAG
ncbi:hypothetical protein AB0M02_12470 [Actinoplanes sp. NPDC051861]|uniref:hypothetical protein n=1 Tax=Actinoplanes sp. NPDC051861 TaxID=3155170 RepID=UPI00343EE4BC